MLPKAWSALKRFRDASFQNKQPKYKEDLETNSSAMLNAESYLRCLAAPWWSKDNGQFSRRFHEIFSYAWENASRDRDNYGLSWRECYSLEMASRAYGTSEKGSVMLTIHRAMYGRYFFISHDGRLRVCPQTTRIGDVIVVLFGGCCSICPSRKADLPTSEQRYELIGECTWMDACMARN
jgi:hypothetical protein